NEAAGIEAALQALQPLRARRHEVIVVDGGSRDDTVQLCRSGADRVIDAPRGRGQQMNAGAAIACGEILMFLHADTRLPVDGDTVVIEALQEPGRCWGRFDVRIESQRPLLRLVSFMMNRRSRWSSICTGDQAIFVSREAFAKVGGYAPVALMEDVELSAQLRRYGPPASLRATVVTSARRWERHRVLRTIASVWGLRLLFFPGPPPARCAQF